MLFQEPFYRIARLCADTKPVLDPVALQYHLSFFVRVNRVVTAQLFDDPAVAGPLTVDRRQPKRRAVSTTYSFQSYPHSHGFLLMPLDTRASCRELRSAAGAESGQYSWKPANDKRTGDWLIGLCG